MSNSKQNNKVIIIGQDRIGKTSLLKKYTKPEIDIAKEESRRTKIADYKLISKTFSDLNNKSIEATCYDTAGEENQKSLTLLFYRNALGIVLVFDLNLFVKKEADCLKQIKQWYQFSLGKDIKHQLTPLVYFVGSKLDLLSQEEQQNYDARRKKLFDYMKQVNKQYYIETSSVKDINIQKVKYILHSIKLFDDVLKGLYLEFLATSLSYQKYKELNVFTLRQSDQESLVSQNSNQSKNLSSINSNSYQQSSSQFIAIQSKNEPAANEELKENDEIKLNNQSKDFENNRYNQKSQIRLDEKDKVDQKSLKCC